MLDVHLSTVFSYTKANIGWIRRDAKTLILTAPCNKYPYFCSAFHKENDLCLYQVLFRDEHTDLQTLNDTDCKHKVTLQRQEVMTSYLARLLKYKILHPNGEEHFCSHCMTLNSRTAVPEGSSHVIQITQPLLGRIERGSVGRVA